MEIKSNGHSIYFNSGLAPLQEIIEKGGYSKVFVLTDENTSGLCLPVFQQLLDDFTGFDLIETSAGEENKTIDFCIGIWKTLLDFGADRKSLLVNLGGGVITDMGGFIAATYKRGIDFINIPTTLLSQVDASVGGKTGIDIDNVKNMVGTFTLPKAVFIETVFLDTLPGRETISGFAEMIKHGLIADKDYFETLRNAGISKVSAELIHRSVIIKHNVVTEDPQEKGLRKILNFGHTIGHAIESYALENDKVPLTHGEAIAIGMVCEAVLSLSNSDLSAAELEAIVSCISNVYPPYHIREDSYEALINLMQSDKKNEDGNIMFSLLKSIGACTFNCRVSGKDILDSFNYYNKLQWK